MSYSVIFLGSEIGAQDHAAVQVGACKGAFAQNFDAGEVERAVLLSISKYSNFLPSAPCLHSLLQSAAKREIFLCLCGG